MYQWPVWAASAHPPPEEDSGIRLVFKGDILLGCFSFMPVKRCEGHIHHMGHKTSLIIDRIDGLEVLIQSENC